MPTYTYRCPECGEFEEQQSIRDPALEVCPSCGRTVKRVITGGTGFFISKGGSSRSHCERETPCCGRSVRCDTPPCGK